MSETNDYRESLRSIRDEVAEFDPAVLEMDLDDPDTALMIVVLGAIVRGESVELVTEEEDGKTATLSFESLGRGSDGQPVTVFSMSSPDGTLSPENAEIAAGLLNPTLQDEAQRAISSE